MPDAISTPGMGAMGIVRALTGNYPGKTGGGKKKTSKSKSVRHKKPKRSKNKIGG